MWKLQEHIKYIYLFFLNNIHVGVHKRYRPIPFLFNDKNFVITLNFWLYWS